MKKSILYSILVCSVCVVAGDFDGYDLFGDEPIGIDARDIAGGIAVPIGAGITSPSSAIENLFVLNLMGFVEQPFYRHTYFPSKRDVLDLPSLFPYTPLRSNIDFTFFYNRTLKLNFTKTGNTINDFTTIGELGDLIQALPANLLPDDTIPLYLQQIRNVFAEERRVGFIFDGFKRTDNGFIFGFRLPFYYLERNWNLPPQNQKRMKELAAIGDGANTTAAPQDQSAYYHLVINDALGFGDMRFIFGCLALETDRFKTVLGADITVPSAFAIQRGVIGSNMSKAYTPQELELIAIFDEVLASPPNIQYATDVAIDFGKNALIQLGAIALKPFLGMEKNTGLSLFWDQHVDGVRGIRYFSRIRLAWYIPQTQNHFFVFNKNPNDFTESALQADPALGLEFVEQNILYNYFPLKAPTKMRTRTMLEVIGGINFDITNNWEFWIAMDYWSLQRDRLDNTKVPKDIIVSLETNSSLQPPINIEAALRPTAIQAKIFGGFTYTSFRERADIEVSLVADQTFANSAIGKDLTLGLRIMWAF